MNAFSQLVTYATILLASLLVSFAWAETVGRCYASTVVCTGTSQMVNVTLSKTTPASLSSNMSCGTFESSYPHKLFLSRTKSCTGLVTPAYPSQCVVSADTITGAGAFKYICAAE